MDTQKSEIAALAARFVVDDGLEYGAAKQQAARQLGVGRSAAWPDNDELEDAVREYIEIFAADTQPGELAALRALALQWMERLAAFRPHLGGAVWLGTATRHSDIYLRLYADDPKALEIFLIDHDLRYTSAVLTQAHGVTQDVLHLDVRCPAFQTYVGLNLLVGDYDDLRGALIPDRRQRTPLGSLESVRRLVHDSGHDARNS